MRLMGRPITAAALMQFLPRGCSLSVRVRSLVTWEEVIIQRSQLRWFRHLYWMLHKASLRGCF